MCRLCRGTWRPLATRRSAPWWCGVDGDRSCRRPPTERADIMASQSIAPSHSESELPRDSESRGAGVPPILRELAEQTAASGYAAALAVVATRSGRSKRELHRLRKRHAAGDALVADAEELLAIEAAETIRRAASDDALPARERLAAAKAYIRQHAASRTTRAKKSTTRKDLPTSFPPAAVDEARDEASGAARPDRRDSDASVVASQTSTIRPETTSSRDGESAATVPCGSTRRTVDRQAARQRKKAERRRKGR